MPIPASGEVRGLVEEFASGNPSVSAVHRLGYRAQGGGVSIAQYNVKSRLFLHLAYAYRNMTAGLVIAACWR